MYLLLKTKKQTIGLMCDLWRQIRALGNRWKTSNSREYISYLSKPCIQFKSRVSWKLSHYCSSCMTGWDACSVQKDSVAPCSFWPLAKTPGLPGREITMSDHAGHQAASTNPSPGACAGYNLSPAPPWATGRLPCPEPVLVFRAWVPKIAWYFTVTSSQRG